MGSIITSTVSVCLCLAFLHVSQITSIKEPFDSLNLFQVFFLSPFVFIAVSHYPHPSCKALCPSPPSLLYLSVSPISPHISLSASPSLSVSLCLYHVKHHFIHPFKYLSLWHPSSISLLPLSLYLCLSKHLPLPMSLYLFMSLLCFFVICFFSVSLFVSSPDFLFLITLCLFCCLKLPLL